MSRPVPTAQRRLADRSPDRRARAADTHRRRARDRHRGRTAGSSTRPRVHLADRTTHEGSSTRRGHADREKNTTEPDKAVRGDDNRTADAAQRSTIVPPQGQDAPPTAAGRTPAQPSAPKRIKLLNCPKTFAPYSDNTYRGANIIKRRVQNPRLRAVLEGRRLRVPKKDKREMPVVRMGYRDRGC